MNAGRSGYLLRRVLAALLTAFVAISLNFFLFRAAPGNAVDQLARVPGGSPALHAELAREFGLSRSLPTQYLLYLRQLASGNLGISFANRQPVWSNLIQAVGNTVPMVLLGNIIAIVLGVLTGLVSAVRRGGILDHSSVGGALIFYSLPAQWLGLIIILLFAGTLPTGGRVDEFLIYPSFIQHQLDILRHMILPALTLGLIIFGQYTLVVRSAMLETLGEDYILTARAKGLSYRLIVRRHALRNAMLPTVSLIGLSLGLVVGGTVLIETVFSWPGIGLATYNAVLQRDDPMLQGAFLLLTLSVIGCNLLADLAYFKLDPRVGT